MINKKCFSFSLYGTNIFYYLLLIANIKIINENNDRYNFGYDIVIYTENECKKILEDILQQENISSKYIKFKYLSKNIGSSGMMWRYFEATQNNYDIVYIHDIDTLIYKRIFFELDDFEKNKNQQYLMIFHTNNKSYQLCDGGNFGFKPKIFKNKQIFEKIILDWLENNDITYFTDELLLNHLFKNKFKSNDLIVYSYLNNKEFIDKEKKDFLNIQYLDENNAEFKNFKCFQISSKQSKEILKYYNSTTNSYILNNKEFFIYKNINLNVKINKKESYIKGLQYL